MDPIKLRYRRMKKAQAVFNSCIIDLEEEILRKSDIEGFVEFHPSDGFMFMSIKGENEYPTGEKIESVIEKILKDGGLTKDNFRPTG